MNATPKPAGLEVGSTKPLSRAERRAAAARVTAGVGTTAGSAVNGPPIEPHADISALATSNQSEPAATPPVQLKARQRKAKSPFATQLHAGTLARLEWIKARGYAITDTVDDAINTYLDNAGIPRPDQNDCMPS
jgi:hypothetical protein